MKVREGFVSNSSSSSFILSVDSEDQKVTITLSVDDLKDMMAENDYDSSSIMGILTTKNDVDEQMVKSYGNNFLEYMVDEPYIEDEYRYMVDMVESGKTVIVGRIMYGDNFLYNLVEKMGGKIEN